jgi:hypothetical protein
MSKVRWAAERQRLAKELGILEADVDTLSPDHGLLDNEAAASEIASLRRRIAELDRRIADDR